MIRRKIEIIAFERERIITKKARRRPAAICCPVCQLNSELLTTAQAGALVQVREATIYRWLVQGKAHGIRTPGGRHRVCRSSLLPGAPAAPQQVLTVSQEEVAR